MAEPDAATVRIELRASGTVARELARAVDAARAAGDGARVRGDGPWSCDVAPGTTLAALLGRLGIGAERPLLVVVRERPVDPAGRASTVLRDGDVVSVTPPIRAG